MTDRKIERDRHTEFHRQKDRDRQTYSFTDRKIETDRHTVSQTERSRQTDRHSFTDRKMANRKTDRHTV